MKTKILIIALVIFNLSFSQSKRVANMYYEHYAYLKAAKIYEKLYKKGNNSKFVVQRIADSYYKNAQTKKSMYWYDKLVKNHKNISQRTLFRYCQSLRANQKYKKSDSILQTLKEHGFKNLDKKTNFLLEYQGEDKVKINNLPINTKFSDFGGFLLNDEFYFASSSPKDNNSKEVYKWNDQPFLDIYKSFSYLKPQMNEENAIDTIFVVEGKKVLPKPINSEYHESSLIFTNDGKTVYFTRVNFDNGKMKKDRKRDVNLKIYKCTYVNGRWSKIKELPFNSDDYSCGHPALSPDEKTLYFTSDMPGTIGETDIYKVAVKNGGKSYGKPINLGSEINTVDREMFPFVDADGSLYFSSNGHISLGLMDIFKSELVDGVFEKPVNLGKPINSNKDDFAFYINKSNKKGFFSSNRDGGKGDDDIYSFYIHEDNPVEYGIQMCDQLVKGYVRDSISKKSLKDAVVKIMNEEGQVVLETKSLEDGYYFFKEIPCGNSFGIFTETANYRSKKVTSKTTNIGHSAIIVNVDLQPLIIGNKIVIKSIYFDVNSAEIRGDAMFELENIVNVMNDNPKMKIKIEAHSDSKGPATYNKVLSDKRAKSTRDYILSRGIAKDRIVSAIGYGEEQLLNHCKDGVKCSKEEHQVNRRSYFIIVEGAPKNLE